MQRGWGWGLGPVPLLLLLAGAPCVRATLSQLGTDLVGTMNDGAFGTSISLSSDGSRMVVGNNPSSQPKAQVFEYSTTSSSWVQLGADLNAQHSNSASAFVVSMSADGLRVALGEPSATGSGGQSQGQVRIFGWKVLSSTNGGVWTQLGPTIFGTNPGDKFGFPISLNSDGSRVACAATLNDDAAACRCFSTVRCARAFAPR